MPEVFLGVGSNINAEKNILGGIKQLGSLFGELLISPAYQSPALGFSGDDFINLVIKINTELSIAALSECLRKLETDFGRPAKAQKYSSRHLDIDILTYGQFVGEVDGIILPRSDIESCAFVLVPLVDIAPEECYPQCDMTYRELLQSSNFESHPLSMLESFSK